MEFTIYDSTTGETVCAGITDSLEQLDLAPGTLAIEGSLSSRAYQADGVSVPMTDQPGENFRFNWATKLWVSTQSLEECKAAKAAEIDTWRDAQEFSTLTWDGSTFACDVISTNRIVGAFGLALASVVTNQPYSEDWTLYDGTTRTLSAADTLAVGTALGKQVSDIHKAATVLKARLESASTVVEVNAVVCA